MTPLHGELQWILMSLFVLSSCLLYSVDPSVLPLPSVPQVSNALCHLLCIPGVSQHQIGGPPNCMQHNKTIDYLIAWSGIV